ncbi:MAG: TolC family protein [Bacteroidota bacterium]
MNRLILLFSVVFLFLGTTIFAQNQDTTLMLTLKQAQDYALKNSPVIKNANLDLESAKKKVWETTAMGLPQVNSKLAYSYMLTVPASIKSFSGLSNLSPWMYGADQALRGITGNPQFGNIPAPAPQEPTNENDMKWGLTYDITATQLLFSGAYIVGLQTAKTFKSLSEINITKSQNDLNESITNAYFMNLVVNENLRVIDSIYKNTETILYEITQLNQKGFIDVTDVDQLTLTLANLKNTKEMLARQCEIAANLLKFQLGVSLTSKIEFADKLDVITQLVNVETLSKSEFKVENYSDYKMLETQERMMGLNVKLQKSTFLPDIAAYYMHDENFNDKSFSFTPPNSVGLSVSIPLFGSGMKLAKVSQAKIGLEKMKNTKYQASLGLQLDFETSRSAYITAISKYSTNKQSVELANRIYNKSIIKQKEGIISSLELTQAQTQYLQAQSNLFTSIIELSSAYSKLEKMLK